MGEEETDGREGHGLRVFENSVEEDGVCISGRI